MSAYYVPTKSSVYVGGLEETVNEDILVSAFLPFGEIVDVLLPKDTETGVERTKSHRGFGFVQFETVEEAKFAIDNMNNAELFGNVLKVNFARTTRIKESYSGGAVWSKDEFRNDDGENAEHAEEYESKKVKTEFKETNETEEIKAETTAESKDDSQQ